MHNYFLRHFLTLKTCEVDHLKQSNWLFPLCILSIVYPRCINSKIIYLHPKCANQSFEQPNMIILLNHYTYQSFEQDNIYYTYQSLYFTVFYPFLVGIVWSNTNPLLFFSNHCHLKSDAEQHLKPVLNLFWKTLNHGSKNRCFLLKVTGVHHFCISITFKMKKVKTTHSDWEGHLLILHWNPIETRWKMLCFEADWEKGGYRVVH